MRAPAIETEGTFLNADGAGVIEGHIDEGLSGAGVGKGAGVVEGMAGMAEVEREVTVADHVEHTAHLVVDHTGHILVEAEAYIDSRVLDGAPVLQPAVDALGASARDCERRTRIDDRRPATGHRAARPGQVLLEEQLAGTGDGPAGKIH